MGLKNERTKLYAKACLETGKDLGVEVLDLWTEMQKTEVNLQQVCKYQVLLFFFTDLKQIDEANMLDHASSLWNPQLVWSLWVFGLCTRIFLEGGVGGACQIYTSLGCCCTVHNCFIIFL